jgi:uncharacterized protein
MDTPRTSFLAAWPLLAAVLLGGLLFIGGKYVEARAQTDTQASITVSGEGRVFAVPDIAELTLGVQTGRQPTAARAMERLKGEMDRVLEAVRAQNIADADIRTENFWLNPVYDYTEGRQVPRGFEANQSVRVKVRDLDRVSAVLGAATGAGANQAGNVRFTIDEPEAVRDEARAKAIRQAKEKARVLADQLGVRLRTIVSFHEGSEGMPYPAMMERSMGMGGAMEDMAIMRDVPMPAGEQEVRINVTLTYEIW